nr:hypothetical protein KitaXyl93_53670 [Kitasatospora sp. Xyl93]
MPTLSAPHSYRSLIEGHGLIGNTATGALVRFDGTISWLCLPRFDFPAVFAALLGTEEHGFWRIGPAADRFSWQLTGATPRKHLQHRAPPEPDHRPGGGVTARFPQSTARLSAPRGTLPCSTRNRLTNMTSWGRSPDRVASVATRRRGPAGPPTVEHPPMHSRTTNDHQFDRSFAALNRPRSPRRFPPAPEGDVPCHTRWLSESTWS